MNKIGSVGAALFVVGQLLLCPLMGFADDATNEKQVHAAIHKKHVQHLAEVVKPAGFRFDLRAVHSEIQVSKQDLSKVTEIFPERKDIRDLISENATFPPLPEELMPGKMFDQKEVEELVPPAKGVWYVVPKWFAGEFSYGQMEVTYEKDFLTGKVERPDEVIPGVTAGRTRGWIVDKKGNIWTFGTGGRVLDAAKPDDDSWYRAEDEIIGQVLSPTEYMESSDGIDIYLDGKRVKDALRYQRIRDFQLEPDGKVAVEVTEIKYMMNGKPEYIVKAKGHMTRQSPFVPLGKQSEADIKGGTYADAVALLRKHMIQAGLEKDAPDPVN